MKIIPTIQIQTQTILIKVHLFYLYIIIIIIIIMREIIMKSSRFNLIEKLKKERKIKEERIVL